MEHLYLNSCAAVQAKPDPSLPLAKEHAMGDRQRWCVRPLAPFSWEKQV
jgi:hypothetical protein